MASSSRPRDRGNFEIAIVCALPLEFDAASLVFDEFWDEGGDQYGKVIGDPNSYTTGRIGKHNVVLALLPNMGKASAAGTAASLRSSYPRLRLAILVGICGGVPSPASGIEVVLGDVIISKRIIQYDFGRQYPGNFVPRNTVCDTPNRSNKNIRSFLAILETEHSIDRLKRNTAETLSQLQRNAKAKGWHVQYECPGSSEDRLFMPIYIHRHRKTVDCGCTETSACVAAATASCEELQCDIRQLIIRKRLQKQQYEHDKIATAAQHPQIFLGNIGSGDTVMKSGEDRDRIAREHNILAFEMEGAGIWDEIPCIVIKGVCDYADSHKNKIWQSFAAAMAASAAKALLRLYIQTDQPVDGHDNRPTILIPFSRDKHFVERGTIFGQIDQKFANGGSRVALVGLGGVG
jgi:nucleoside phosphorylase